MENHRWPAELDRRHVVGARAAKRMAAARTLADLDSLVEARLRRLHDVLPGPRFLYDDGPAVGPRDPTR